MTVTAVFTTTSIGSILDTTTAQEEKSIFHWIEDTEMQMKKNLQQGKRLHLLSGGLALLLDHWKERRLGCALLPFSNHKVGTSEHLDS